MLWDRIVPTRLSRRGSDSTPTHATHSHTRKSSSASTVSNSSSNSPLNPTTAILSTSPPQLSSVPLSSKPCDVQVDDFLVTFGQIETNERKLGEKWSGFITKRGSEGVKPADLPRCEWAATVLTYRFLIGMHGQSELDFLIKKDDLNAKHAGTVS